MTSETKIALQDVAVAFGDFVAIKHVDLNIWPHEWVCIVGTSGGGKTTLLRAVGGLVQPQSGQILLDGELVDGPSPRIGMIFQNFGLFPWKTVRANIEYGLRVQGKRPVPAEVDRLLGLMQLTDAATKYPYQLSGGMQQRVGIARALAVQPEVLLMDEPFGSLDALTRETLQTELLQLWEHQSQMTAALVTHDIDEAILLGDRIAVLTGRPGAVEALIDVPIERPRDAQEIRFHPEYARLRRRIWDVLHADQLRLAEVNGPASKSAEAAQEVIA